MPKKEMVTSLRALAKALCHKDTVPLFPNQVVMYQFLIAICGGNESYVGDAGSMEEMLHEMCEFVKYKASCDMSKSINNELASKFSALHRRIYGFVANTKSEAFFDPIVGDTRLLSVKSLNEANLSGSGNIESNISNTISGKRNMPQYWSKLIAKDDGEYKIILKTIFCVLQYYVAYYKSESDLVCRNNTISSLDSDFNEYYSLSERGRILVYTNMVEHCGGYSKLIEGLFEHTFDMYILSKIILDIIIDMVNKTQMMSYKRITDIVQLSGDVHALTEPNQLRFFHHNIDCYGPDSFDRYQIIKKYAHTNCYAANELGLIYFWGKTFYISKTNVFKVTPNRKKAVECFYDAVTLSNPHLQSACWSLAYTIELVINENTENEAGELRKLADKIYQMCGDYPPALNNRALRLLSLGYEDYKSGNIDYSNYVKRVAHAMDLLFRSSEAGWVLAYNNIATFLLENDDKKLHDDIEKESGFKLNDATYYLKRSAGFGNLWAMKKLALIYIDSNQQDEAKKWLEKGMEYEYAKAYYLMAVHFSSSDIEYRRLLESSAKLGEPAAAYDLGEMYYNLSDYDIASKWYYICLHQLRVSRNTDTSLYQKVKERLDSFDDDITLSFFEGAHLFMHGAYYPVSPRRLRLEPPIFM